MRTGRTRPRLTIQRRLLLDRLLDQLLEADEPERSDLLERVGRRAPRLHVWLVDLMAASMAPTRYLQTVFERLGDEAESDLAPEEVSLPPGTRLGPWRVIRTAGSGGMGTVYQAERADGTFEMIVAIKLIRLQRDGLDERLRMERRLLARLDHRHIARLIDGGTTQDDLAYLVIEWVEGHDLNEFISEFTPDIQTRLALFAQIADAVGHAHQRRVVHGDLKPANIRLTETGEVRLLDFGVARLVLEDEASAVAPVKALTPAFSAPEQLRGEAVSTQSDVWSMGAVLQWLFGGGIRDKQAGRRVELDARLHNRADLEAIIDRACAEDPGDRYAGVAQLHDDVRRYQACLPVLARSGNRGYELRRFVQRHRLGVGLGAVISLAMCMAVAAAVWQGIEATNERDRAELARDQAQFEADKSSQVSAFLVSLFRQADPRYHGGSEPTASDLARTGIERVDALDDRPELQSELLLVMSEMQLALGNHDEAESLISRAVSNLAQTSARNPESDEPEYHEGLARLYDQLSRSLVSAGEFDSAAQAIRRALALADPADERLQASLLTSYGVTLRHLGDFETSVNSLEQALALWQKIEPGGEAEASARNNMSLPLFRLGREEEARYMMETALALYRDELGSDHVLTVNAEGNLGSLLSNMGELDAAEPHLLAALEARRAILGEHHPAVGNTQHGIGLLHFRRGEWGLAEQFLRQAIATRQEAWGPDHFSLAATRIVLGRVLTRQGRYDQARDELSQALEIAQRTHGQTHISVANARHALGRLEIEASRPGAATAHLEQAVAIRGELTGEVHRDVVASAHQLARAYYLSGDLQLALDWARRAVALGQSLDKAPEEWQRTEIMELKQQIMAGHGVGS